MPIGAEQPSGEVRWTEDQCAAFYGDVEGKEGKLIVTSEHVMWKPSDGSQGITLEYPAIMIHAISRDTTAFPSPCLYCQLDDDEVVEVRFVPRESENLDSVYEAVTHCASLHPDEDDGMGDAGDMFTGEMFDATMFADAEDDEDGDAGVYMNGGENGFAMEEQACLPLGPEGVARFTNEEDILALAASDPSARANLDHLNSVFQVAEAAEFEDMVQFEDAPNDNMD